MNSMKDRMDAALACNRRDFLKSGSFATLMTMMGGVPLLAENNTAEQEKQDSTVKVKVGLIGLGAWGGHEILRVLGRLGTAEVAALCDTYPAYLKRCARDFPNAIQTADYKTILDNKDIPAIIIATPTHKHKEIALAAIKAGKHVYCEAPLANSIEDAREIVLAARAAKLQIFQSGLQLRSDPERLFLLPFIRSGDLGKNVMARAQWHNKQSWRAASSNPDQEKALNWRLDKSISLGLAGEVAMHQIDQARWFLNARPRAVTGFGGIMLYDEDGREVPDTMHAIFEFPKKVIFNYDCTLANSFDAEYEVYYGSYGAVMLRDGKAWMFKEVDSPLFGWEVYARKDQFYDQTGISLVAGASKQTKVAEGPASKSANEKTPLMSALGNFLRNSFDLSSAVDGFIKSYGADDKDGLEAEAAKTNRRPAAGYLEGFEAVVTAVKTNEAVLTGQRVAFKPEWFELG
jgi:predicted dehydrogenase